MVKYQFNLGPFFNYLQIYLYNIGNELIYVYLVKILQNNPFLEKIVLPLKLLLLIVSDDIGNPDPPPSFYQLFWHYFNNFFY